MLRSVEDWSIVLCIVGSGIWKVTYERCMCVGNVFCWFVAWRRNGQSWYLMLLSIDICRRYVYKERFGYMTRILRSSRRTPVTYFNIRSMRMVSQSLCQLLTQPLKPFLLLLGWLSTFVDPADSSTLRLFGTREAIQGSKVDEVLPWSGDIVDVAEVCRSRLLNHAFRCVSVRTAFTMDKRYAMDRCRTFTLQCQ